MKCREVQHAVPLWRRALPTGLAHWSPSARMFSGTKGTVSIVTAIIVGACLVSSQSAWPLPVSMSLRRSSSVDLVHRALLAEGRGYEAAGGSFANPWARGTAAARPAYWLPSELGVHHYTIAGALSALYA